MSRTAKIITGLSAVLLLVLLLTLGGGRDPVSRYGRDPSPDSWSTSAIGFAGLYKVLEASMGGAGRQAGPGGEARRGRLHVSTGDAPPPTPGELSGTLVAILPKWTYFPHHRNRGWVGPIAQVDPSLPREAARRALGLRQRRGPDAEIVRTSWPSGLAMDYDGTPPEGSGAIQLLDFQDLPANMRPVISCPKGILVLRADTESGAVFVVSDPDVLNNMGLAVGGNPAFAVDLFRHLRASSGASGPPIFLEGGPRRGAGGGDSDAGPSALLSTMLKFPMIIVTILVAATIALVALAASGRFGGLPVEPSETAFGKAKLIDNSARLLALSGESQAAIDDYLDLSLRLCGRLTRAPAGIAKAELMGWLAASAKARGMPDPAILAARAARVRQGANRTALVACARNIHSWRTDLEHGPASRKRDSR